MTDGDLVRRTLSGRTDAYADLVRRWAPRAVAFCRSKLKSESLAEDFAQEALLRGFRALTTLAEPEKFGAWLFGIAHRACLDWLKARERSQVTFGALGRDRNPEDFLDSRPRTEPEEKDREEIDRLLEEVDSLPEEYREVVMLYYYDDVTYRDIAAMLGVSPATVNARLTKARQLLRERLSGTAR